MTNPATRQISSRKNIHHPHEIDCLLADNISDITGQDREARNPGGYSVTLSQLQTVMRALGNARTLWWSPCLSGTILSSAKISKPRAWSLMPTLSYSQICLISSLWDERVFYKRFVLY